MALMSLIASALLAAAPAQASAQAADTYRLMMRSKPQVEMDGPSGAPRVTYDICLSSKGIIHPSRCAIFFDDDGFVSLAVLAHYRIETGQWNSGRIDLPETYLLLMASFLGTRYADAAIQRYSAIPVAKRTAADVAELQVQQKLAAFWKTTRADAIRYYFASSGAGAIAVPVGADFFPRLMTMFDTLRPDAATRMLRVYRAAYAKPVNVRLCDPDPAGRNIGEALCAFDGKSGTRPGWITSRLPYPTPCLDYEYGVCDVIVLSAMVPKEQRDATHRKSFETLSRFACMARPENMPDAPDAACVAAFDRDFR